MTSRIAIKNMQFHGFHGCLPEEAVIGTTYTVCVEFVFDIKTAAHNDSLRILLIMARFLIFAKR